MNYFFMLNLWINFLGIEFFVIFLVGDVGIYDGDFGFVDDSFVGGSMWYNVV